MKVRVIFVSLLSLTQQGFGMKVRIVLTKSTCLKVLSGVCDKVQLQQHWLLGPPWHHIQGEAKEDTKLDCAKNSFLPLPACAVKGYHPPHEA